MREIDINIEGYNVNGICVGCLNYNRLMFYEDAVVKLCFKLIADIDLPDGLTIQLCWECLAAIKKVIRFRDQILKSHDVLVGYSQKHTFLDSPEDFTKHATTHLVCTPVQIDSFHNVEEPTEVKDENKVDIEIDTVKVKDEPESFYNYFDKVEDTQDCDDKIEDTQDFDDKIFEDFQNQNDTQNLSSDEDLQLSELKKKKERKDKKKKGKKKVKVSEFLVSKKKTFFMIL